MNQGFAGRYNSNGWQVQLTQPLFRWQNWVQYKQGEMQAALADAQYQLAVQDLTLRASQAYFDVLGAQDVLAAAQALNEANAQQLALAKKSFEVGTVTITDVHEAQSRSDLSSAQVIAAESDLAVKRHALLVLTGKEPDALKGLRKGVALSRPTRPTSSRGLPPPRPATRRCRPTSSSARSPPARSSATAPATCPPSIWWPPTATRPPATLGNFSSYNTDTTVVGVQLAMPLFQGGRRIPACARPRPAREGRLRPRQRPPHRRPERPPGLPRGDQRAGPGEGLRGGPGVVLLGPRRQQARLRGGVRINIDVLNAQSQLSTPAEARQGPLRHPMAQLKLKAAAGTLGDEGHQGDQRFAELAAPSPPSANGRASGRFHPRSSFSTPPPCATPTCVTSSPSWNAWANSNGSRPRSTPPRDDRDLRPRAAAGGPAILFETPGPFGAGAANLFRHAPARGAGHGRAPTTGRARCAKSASCWPSSRNPSRRRASRTPGTSCRCSGRCSTCRPRRCRRRPARRWSGRARRGPRQPADPALLAGRRGAADHLGPGRRAARTRTARTWASTASRCSGRTRSSCAGWPTGAARWISSTTPASPASRSRWRWCWRDPATILGAVTPVPGRIIRIPVRRPPARRQDRAGEVPRLRPAGAGVSAEIVLEGVIHPSETAAGRPLRRPHRLLQRAGRGFRCSPSSASPPPRPDLPQHLHRQAARRAGDARRGAQRGLRAALQKQFPEIVDFYLPPEGCSYRLAVVSIKKQYPATPSA